MSVIVLMCSGSGDGGGFPISGLINKTSMLNDSRSMFKEVF